MLIEAAARCSTDSVSAVMTWMSRSANSRPETHAGEPLADGARRAGGDRDGEVEREEGLAALGLAADDAARLVAPQLLDEPAPLGRHVGELGGARDRQRERRRHRRAVFVGAGVAVARAGR